MNRPENLAKFELPPTLSTQSYRLKPEQAIFIASNAVVLGDIRLKEQVSIWYHCVLRGDLHYIEVGQGSNIQDGCIIHVANDAPCVIKNWVTVGHRACLHGCTVEEKALIGIGAIVLNRATIGRGAVIAAGAVIKENEVVPPLTLMAGVPARKIRTLPENTLNDHYRWAQKYILLAQKHGRTDLKSTKL